MMSLSEYIAMLPLPKQQQTNPALKTAAQLLIASRRKALMAEHRLAEVAWVDVCKHVSALGAITSEEAVVTAVATALKGRALHGPAIRSPRPQVLGRVIKKRHIEEARKQSARHKRGSAPPVRIPKREALPPVSTANHHEWTRIIQRYDDDCASIAGRLFRPPVWATFDERDSSLDPFQGITTARRANDLLALGWPLGETKHGALLVRYTPAPKQTLHYPTLADAVWSTSRGGDWHPHFFPAPSKEFCGRSKPCGSAARQQGAPELVHGRIPSTRVQQVRVVL